MTSSSNSPVSVTFDQGAHIQATSSTPDERASKIRIDEDNAKSLIRRDEAQHKFLMQCTAGVLAVCAVGMFFAETSLKPLCLDMLKVVLAALLGYKAAENRTKH